MLIRCFLSTVSNVPGLHDAGCSDLYSDSPNTPNCNKVGGAVGVDCPENIKTHPEKIAAYDQFRSSARLGHTGVVRCVVSLPVRVRCVPRVTIRTTVDPSSVSNRLAALWAQTWRCYTFHDNLHNRLSTLPAVDTSAGAFRVSIIASQCGKHNTTLASGAYS